MQTNTDEAIIIEKDTDYIKSLKEGRLRTLVLVALGLLLPAALAILTPIVIEKSFGPFPLWLNVGLIFIAIALVVLILYGKNFLNFSNLLLKDVPVRVELNPNGVTLKYEKEIQDLMWTALENIQRFEVKNPVDSQTKFEVSLSFPGDIFIDLEDNANWDNYLRIIKWSGTELRAEPETETE